MTDDLDGRVSALRDAVDAALRDADPIELIRVGAPPDEYTPEVRTIVPRLLHATERADVLRIVHEEFVRWFNAGIAGPTTRYEAASARIWDALVKFRRETGAASLEP